MELIGKKNIKVIRHTTLPVYFTEQKSCFQCGVRLNGEINKKVGLCYGHMKGIEKYYGREFESTIEYLKSQIQILESKNKEMKIKHRKLIWIALGLVFVISMFIYF